MHNIYDIVVSYVSYIYIQYFYKKNFIINEYTSYFFIYTKKNTNNIFTYNFNFTH